MKKIILLFRTLIIVILSLLLSTFIYMNYFSLFGHTIFGNTFVIRDLDFTSLVMVLVLSTILYISFQFLLTRKLQKNVVVVLYIVYFLFLIYLLFLKNIGIRGFSIMPFDFLHSFEGYGAFVVCMNMLMFIPLGFILKLTKKHLIYVIFSCFLIESIQYLFYLGIFDIDDIVLNTLGYFLGARVAETKWFQRIKECVE